jgi:3-hydroxyacyl-CoA dehydrogenase/enoyl-CoA hydratase/3-hydroxybutyryl-CoA epimerase
VLSAIYYGAGCHIDKALKSRLGILWIPYLVRKPKYNPGFLLVYQRCGQRQIEAKGYENATFKSGCHRSWNDGCRIAYVNAKAGIDVVLKDVSLSKAESGKDYVKAQEQKSWRTVYN